MAKNLDERPTIRELAVPAEEGQLGRVRDFIVDVCEQAGFTAREASNTKLAVDEACTNIIKHAYAGGVEGKIAVRVEISTGRLNIILRDTGKHFDFSKVEDPDLDQYVETGRKGGFGVFLINRLMDGVDYRATATGNELVLFKRSQSALAELIPDRRPFRGTLRYKFTMRASLGLLALMTVLWGFVFSRQTSDIGAQRTSRWLEKRRIAQNVASRSVKLLLQSEEFSPEQTQMSSDLAKLVVANREIAYIRVVDTNLQIVSSGNIDEIFDEFQEPVGKIDLDDGRFVWTSTQFGGETVVDIATNVTVRTEEGAALRILGRVYFGSFTDAVEAGIEDNRLATTLLLVAIFAIGVLLIVGLVQVFVRPIQVLTDGVRRIGDGNLSGKLDIQGPAEIGAIASVFNEITDKFRTAQDSLLEQEKLQKEMEVAKEIQQSLLPNWKPVVSGYDIAPLYKAAAEVGGDYYDFVRVDEDTIGVVVADVSGKGVPGSLVMTMIRTALRMESRGNKNASDVMAKMNAFVTDDMKKGMFVTMFYVILDSKNRTISYASAGHNPMILYRHETKETFFLNPKGFPVGISLPDESLFRKSISLEKIKLKKDDMLLIYTDGVTEAMNERREQYGEDRLIETVKKWGHLSPEEYIEKLDADVKGFTAGHPQNDDITVVAIKEKLAADDVLFGIRKKLIDLVDVTGLTVKEACEQMRVSPATYYRYKKRLELHGERGLKNKVLREDQVLRRVSLEARKKLLSIIAEHPEWGAKRITVEYNTHEDTPRHITERMVYDELRRLNLNTKDLRMDYLRRHDLLKDKDSLIGEDAKQLVDGLLDEIAGTHSVADAGDVDIVSDAREEGDHGELIEELEDLDDRPPEEYEPAPTYIEAADGLEIGVVHADSGVATMSIIGHIDSVTSAALEQQIKDLTGSDVHKLIVDLTNVTYISSGGWGVFTGEVGGLRQRSGDIVLCGMSAEVYDVYELLGFADVVRSFMTVKESHEYFELSVEERLSIPQKPVVDGQTSAIDASLDIVGGGSEWESLQIEATTVGEKGDIAVIGLRGIIDTVSATNLRDALSKVIDGKIYKIVVDMSQVEYVSSGGWGTFTERLRELRRAGGDIKLFGMDADVYYVFSMLGFNIVISSFDILAAAIEDFGSGADPATETDEHVAHDSGASVPDDTGATKESDDDFLDGLTRTVEPPADTDVVRWDEEDESIKIARLSGAIEATVVGDLATSITRALADEPRVVLLDFTRVSYVSSSGWGQVARCTEMCRSWGGVVALFGMSVELHDVYSCLEFHAFVSAHETEEEAIRSTMGIQSGSDSPVIDDFESSETTAEEIDTVLDTPVMDISTTDPVSTTDETVADEPDSRTLSGPEDRPLLEHHDPEQTVEEDDAFPNVPSSEELKDLPSVQIFEDFPPVIPASSEVDVSSAVSDKNQDADKKLRGLGWDKYGARLRKRRKAGGKGDN